MVITKKISFIHSASSQGSQFGIPETTFRRLSFSSFILCMYVYICVYICTRVSQLAHSYEGTISGRVTQVFSNQCHMFFDKVASVVKITTIFFYIKCIWIQSDLKVCDLIFDFCQGELCWGIFPKSRPPPLGSTRYFQLSQIVCLFVGVFVHSTTS